MACLNNPLTNNETMTTKELNALQQNAILDICDHLATSPKQKAYALLGSAGTGKSFTISQLFKVLPNIACESIFMTPTHTAKKVLRGFLKENNLDIQCSTIHSGLGLSVSESEGVKRTKKRSEQSAVFYKYWFIDEASMVDLTLATELICTANSCGAYLVALGDKLQLPPVSKKNGKFPLLDDYVYASTELIEPMRYGGTISDFVELSKFFVREQILYNPLKQLVENKDKSDCPIKIKKDDVVGRFVEDKSQVLAFTNRTVQRYNFKIREKVMGLTPRANDFLIDEFVVANDVLQDALTGEIVATNGTELDIKHIEKTEVYSPLGDGFTAYRLGLTPCDEPYHPGIEVSVIDRNALSTYEAHLKKLKDIAIKASSTDKRQCWQNYYAFKRVNAPIRHHYACTIHKSQGQSIYNPIVVNDFGFLKDTFMQPRLWYVAMSRTKGQLTIAL